MNIIIFDFEVFKYDTLLGVIELHNNEEKLIQMWNLDDIKNYFYAHRNDLWVGHNNWCYDDLILEGIIENKDPYNLSRTLINSKFKPRCKLKIFSYDLMNSSEHKYKLKLTELLIGKNIHTTEVDFNINRPLNEEEILKTNSYNKSDLEQTLYNFKAMYKKVKLRLDIIKEFKLPIIENLKVTGTKLAANVLGAVHDDSIQYKLIKPTIYPQLRLKNKRLLDFYLNEEFRKGCSDVIHVAGADITIAAGGAHSAIKKYHTNKFLYFDVSGYYNLIMINFDLLPRTMNEEAKKLYVYMYHEQLRLKKIDPIRRAMYKTILLSVFGAMNNEFTDFYDPQKALLVTITGQLFIVDLLEKLEGLVKVIQTNTDGIMVEPLDWNDEKKIIGIVEEWESRTGFVIKKEHKYNLWQRDVNCYFCVDDKGVVEYKGDALKNYDIGKDAFSTGDIFNCKEPPIIAQGIIACLKDYIMPEDFVNQHKDDLILFQYIAKQNTYEYITYETFTLLDASSTMIKIDGGICRAFAYNNKKTTGMIYKYKTAKGKLSRAKVSNLPPSVFIHNQSILDEKAIKEIQSQIDYDYYIKRIYEKVETFINMED